ncbi:MAG: glycosyltransferase family 4 protein [Deltaproteobacteria bacterium]|nr:glycosyltransferase family 4 protein [Deltaproteobacteria bacterium]MCX7952672.1 glycosyltransferase family 4 protein [Deltaproteobacteria bacterium]
MYSLGVISIKWGKEAKSGAERAITSLVELLDSSFQVTVYCGQNLEGPSQYVSSEGCLIKIKTFRMSDENSFSSGEPHRVLRKALNYATLSVKEEEVFFRNLHFSQELLDCIRKEAGNLDAIIVTPYLSGTGIFASIELGSKVVMIPCFHREHFANFKLVNLAFQRIRGVLCYSHPERQALLERHPHLKTAVTGVPIYFAQNPQNHVGNENKTTDTSYLLYLGRKEPAKGLLELVDFVRAYNEGFGATLKLVVAGPGKIPLVDPRAIPWLEDIESPDEDRKNELIKNALVLVQPSKNESFSLVIMEAWINRVPVMVNRFCDVTTHFVKESQGGFAVKNFTEFCEAISLLERSPSLRERLGERGHDYVIKNFSPEHVKKQLLESLQYYLG